MPSTFFGFPFSCFPSRTPPTRPAAAVATPATTAVFDEPFEPAPDEPLRDALLRDAPLREEPLFEEPLRDDALREVPLRDALLRDDPLREEPLLDDRFADELLPEDPLREDALPLRLLDALPLFGLDPFELRLFELRDVFLFVPELELLWAIAPPWSLPRAFNRLTPLAGAKTHRVQAKNLATGEARRLARRASLEGNSFVDRRVGPTAVAAPSR